MENDRLADPSELEDGFEVVRASDLNALDRTVERPKTDRKKLKVIEADDLRVEWSTSFGVLGITKVTRSKENPTLTFNLRETEALISSLLSVLPFLHDRTRHAWAVRHEPRFRLLQTWTPSIEDDQPTIRLGAWTVEISILDTIVHRRADFPTQHEALDYARRYLEDDIAEPTEIVEDEVSRLVASERAYVMLVEHLCQKHGMTPTELAKHFGG